MKSELYHTIYKVAVFCMIATLGLTVGGLRLSTLVMGDADKSNIVVLVSWGVTAIGAILFFFSIAVSLHFRKRFLVAAEEEEKQRKEAEILAENTE